MPAAGETAHVRRLIVDRSRCGLEVSPAPPAGSDIRRSGRRPVVAQACCERLSRRMWGRRPGRPDGCCFHTDGWGPRVMEIIFKGRQTDVPARFRKHATAKLNRLEKLDQKAIRVDVEVSVERNPRQASQKERVELTVRSRGPAIRAEAAAEDRFSALDLALAKLDSRLRRGPARRATRGRIRGTCWGPGAGRAAGGGRARCRRAACGGSVVRRRGADRDGRRRAARGQAEIPSRQAYGHRSGAA